MIGERAIYHFSVFIFLKIKDMLLVSQSVRDLYLNEKDDCRKPAR